MDKRFERVINVLGGEALGRLRHSTVLIAGLGGVGSYSVEACVRSGVGRIIIADRDVVEASNLNRQIEATAKTIGQRKTDVMEERMRSISPDLEIIKKDLSISSETVNELFEARPDYVIDAIDSTEGKLAIWQYCQDNGIPFIASMGMARRMDITQLYVTTLNKTENDPLAKNLRYLARQRGLDLKLKVVISGEKALPVTKDENGRTILGSMIFVPAAAGLICAREAVSFLSSENK